MCVLHQQVQNNWRNRLKKPTDFEEVKRCIEIALRCLEVDRCSRPTIGEIVHQLSETEIRIHNLSTQPPHWLRNDSVALDNSKNVPVSYDKQRGNDSGPSMQQAPPVLVFYYIRRLFPYHFSINYNIIRFKHTAQGKCSQENTMPWLRYITREQ
jgi:hypothetical protein